MNIYNYFSLASSEDSDDAFLSLVLENLRSANPKPNRPAPVINTHSSSELIDGNAGSIRARNKMTQVDDTTQNAPMTLLEDQRWLAPESISFSILILYQIIYIRIIYLNTLDIFRCSIRLI